MGRVETHFSILYICFCSKKNYEKIFFNSNLNLNSNLNNNAQVLVNNAWNLWKFFFKYANTEDTVPAVVRRYIFQSKYVNKHPNDNENLKIMDVYTDQIRQHINKEKIFHIRIQ